MRFGAWLDYWLEHVVDVPPGTKKSYARTARLYLNHPSAASAWTR